MLDKSKLVVLALVTWAMIGCGGPGYRVVRSSAQVEFDPGPWVLLPMRGPEGADLDGVAEGARAGLAADAPGFPLEPGEVVPDGAFGLRLTVRELSTRDGAATLDVEVEFVDSAGEVPDEIEVRLSSTPEDTEPSARALGLELGRRIAHFIHSREHHHY